MTNYKMWLYILMFCLGIPQMSCSNNIPFSGTLSSSNNIIQLLIPLYSYPVWYTPKDYIWDDIITASHLVSITTIINPNNGPGGIPNADYQEGLRQLRNNPIRILGYVSTQYAQREIDDVQRDIDIYAQYFDIDGIFLDEVTNTSDKIGYYKKLSEYIKKIPKFQSVFLNPGTHINEEYVREFVGDTVVVFEDEAINWSDYQPNTYIQNYPSTRFAILIHSIPDILNIATYLKLAISRNISYVYLTDDRLPNPWDSLPIFWENEINYIKSLNQSR